LLPSPKVMQYDDTHYAPHYYTTTGGDPNVLDHTDQTAVDHYIINSH
jgi:hypothetical protein